MEIVENNLLIVKDNSKRLRKSNAVKLPPEIYESMIPKYVVYYKECYNHEKMLFREFFKIEKHPKIITNKVYTSSKSNKINILDKLKQIKIILENIEKDEKNEKNEKDIKDEKNEKDIKDEKNEKNEKDIKDEKDIKNVQDEKEVIKKITLPKYVSLKKYKNNSEKYYLIFDKKVGENRQTYKSLCNNTLTISQNLHEFLNKINKKYY